MKLYPDPEIRELAASVHRLFSTHYTLRPPEVGAPRAAYDRLLWRRLTEEIGAAALAVPERLGGAGATVFAQGLVFEQLGYALWDGPYLASVGLALPLLTAIGSDQAAELAASIAAGSTVAALAAYDGATPVTAHGTGEMITLHGVKDYVVDGDRADVLLVVADSGRGRVVAAVNASDPSVRRRQLDGLDLTRGLTQVDFAAAPAQVLASDTGIVEASLARANDVSTTLLAMEEVGGAQRCLDLGTEYATVRYQYGRAIGSYQVIKHLCADMSVVVEAARSAAYFAAWAADESPEDLAAAASFAKAITSDAFVQVAKDSIQIHGGIGFTWEHVAHLFFRRAHSSALLLGTAADHRDRLADLLGLTG